VAGSYTNKINKNKKKGVRAMRKCKYKSFDDLPLMLTVSDVADVLGIGLAHTYEVVRQKDFPTITLGSRIIVPRDKFLRWIEEKSAG